MKKLVSLLLALTLTLCCLSAAMADQAYMLIQTVLADETVLGTPDYCEVMEDSTDAVLLCIDVDSDEPGIFLLGYNSDDEYEGTVWSSSVTATQCLAVLNFYCTNYAEYAADCTTGTFAIGYRFDTDDDYSFISSEEDAASMAEAIDNAINGEDASSAE